MRAQRERVQLLREAGADPDDITIAQCKYQAILEEYRAFSSKMKLPTQMERVYTGRTPGRISPSPQTYAAWQAEQINKAKERVENHRREDMEAAQKSVDHVQWLRDIGATNTNLNTLDKYKEAKHNKTEEYILLNGYGRAVEKGDISPLVGFEQYQKTAAEVQNKIVGQKTKDGIQITSYTTHFVDRIIGQSAEAHAGKRQGVKTEEALDALLNPIEIKERVMADGEVRRSYKGARASVAFSVTDQRVIQANPKRGTTP